MSQVLANPDSSDPPENNDPPKVETLTLPNFPFCKNKGYFRYPEQMKCHTDQKFINNDYLTFLVITLKVQDIHYLFSKSIPFTFFCDFIF